MTDTESLPAGVRTWPFLLQLPNANHFNWILLGTFPLCTVKTSPPTHTSLSVFELLLVVLKVVVALPCYRGE